MKFLESMAYRICLFENWNDLCLSPVCNLSFSTVPDGSWLGDCIGFFFACLEAWNLAQLDSFLGWAFHLEIFLLPFPAGNHFPQRGDEF